MSGHTAYPGRFPASRQRRWRQAAWSRALIRETRLTPEDLVWAIILKDGEGIEEPVPHLPGVSRLSPDRTVAAARKAAALGIPALALFPFTGAEARSSDAAEAINPDNLMCRTAKAIKDSVPEIGLICDVALDPYTDHGHDGLMGPDGTILNDPTVEVLCEQALVQAKAGFDIVAPSDMMDGRIGAIRSTLEGEGQTDTLILSYAVKYASVFYGPYRGAIGSEGVLKGDKKTYQMDPANHAEGLRETAMDIAEGADGVMVKPGLPYLDMITRLKDAFPVPVFAFQVSGEYAMIAAAAADGAFNKETAILESLASFRRAGADAVLTYFAAEAAAALEG